MKEESSRKVSITYLLTIVAAISETEYSTGNSDIPSCLMLVFYTGFTYTSTYSAHTNCFHKPALTDTKILLHQALTGHFSTRDTPCVLNTQKTTARSNNHLLMHRKPSTATDGTSISLLLRKNVLSKMKHSVNSSKHLWLNYLKCGWVLQIPAICQLKKTNLLLSK